ncbi:DUF58 domain-containing protein [Microbacterium gorillae]|uniref:DUF58 domain-containing protein n=1 Tax=Microbacterium gorillae TaxID=1231063 RepID=UPI00058D0B86|nr:DUF58 domain-containing protein [Microbacterium gorillae]
MRRRWPLTLRGTLSLVLAFVVLVVSARTGLIPLAIAGVALLVLPVLGLATLWWGRGSVTIARRIRSTSPSVGDEVPVDLRVSTTVGLAAGTARWVDGHDEGFGGAASGAFRGGERLVGQQTFSAGYEVTARRRGVHALGPLTIITEDAFGLSRRVSVYGEPLMVTIAPAVVELVGLPMRAAEASGALNSTTSRLGEGMDNLIARPYAAGDSMRRIHWRATAHHGELMVRQEERETAPEATVVLDCSEAHWDAAARASPGSDPEFEAAVSLTASAAIRLLRDGYRVRVLDAGGAAFVPLLAVEDDVPDMLLTLSTVRAHGGAGAAELRTVISGAARGPVILIVGRMAEADRDAVARLAGASGLPVLISAGMRTAELAPFRAHGWRVGACAPADPDGVANAWESARTDEGLDDAP